jgi:hypothetical protein
MSTPTGRRPTRRARSRWGSVATPDQDIVDEIGRALGVEQEIDAPVRASDEILRARDRLRWHLERDAADAEEGRSRKRKG